MFQKSVNRLFEVTHALEQRVLKLEREQPVHPQSALGAQQCVKFWHDLEFTRTHRLIEATPQRDNATLTWGTRVYYPLRKSAVYAEFVSPWYGVVIPRPYGGFHSSDSLQLGDTTLIWVLRDDHTVYGAYPCNLTRV